MIRADKNENSFNSFCCCCCMIAAAAVEEVFLKLFDDCERKKNRFLTIEL